jgi:uncharacterized protein YndB with AHSA1/START domain
MTSPKPTGRVAGNDLILTRTFRAPIADVWKSVTDSESCARWFGRWEGDAGPGKTIRLQMVFEKEQPWQEMTIEACEPPRRLAVTSKGDYGVSLLLTFEQTGETTTMTFVHHLADKKMAPDYGPGWEYYLDNLVAAEAAAPLPKFEDYDPSQREHFLAQIK